MQQAQQAQRPSQRSDSRICEISNASFCYTMGLLDLLRRKEVSVADPSAPHHLLLITTQSQKKPTVVLIRG